MAAARKKDKKNRRVSQVDTPTRGAKASDKPDKDADTGTAGQGRVTSGPARRDIRPLIYAGFDAAMAVLYAVLLVKVFPSNHASTQLLAYLMIVSALAMGGAMFARNRWGWRVAVGGCAVLLCIAVTVLVLLLVSAAFLAGVYGAFGQAASIVTLVAAAMTIQLVALLPALQLKFLMTRAGRRHFGRAPLWP